MNRRDEQDEDTTTSIEVELDLISKPEVMLNSSIDENIISLDHSYGYDCKRMYNLVMMDINTLVFASGNLIHFFDLPSLTVTTRRSACGGGIGCVAKNPNPDYNYLTVGENGKKPTIFIYKFPEMELIAMLKKGTKRLFSILDYTADGELLASQGGEPDIMITIWDWKRKEIKLRAKSFSNDVVNLMFSPFIPEQLTTCGLGHIKFWKMSSTFTGLKLQGLIGRFGKTEICDIYGICALPDEKILSGSEWGNVLVWENGLIKLEVCRKNRRPCHKGPITQIFMRNPEEIMTVGTDGFIRIWFWETVELSDPPEDDRFVEIEPSHEFRVGLQSSTTELLKIIKIDAEERYWIAQDGLGGIFWCDLSTEVRPLPPKQLFRCHAGEIVSMETSSVMNHVATLGRDGRLYIYDYLQRAMIFHHQFLAAGCDFLWVPASVDRTGAVMILGFSDGVIRIITFDHQAVPNEQYQLLHAVKCHCKPITKISINPKGTIFVSASEDSTIFIHQLVKESVTLSLKPIGFVCVPSPVTCINWNPLKWATIIAGCKQGDVVQIDMPEHPNAYTETSFHLSRVPIIHFKFKSIKSQIRRNEKIKQIEAKKDQKRQRKLKDLEKLRKENYGLDIDEEAFLAETDEDELLDPIHTPEPPNPILCIQFTSDNTLWLSVGGFDAGYIYECRTDDGELLSFNMIAQADDIEIHSYVHFDEYLFLGMGDGKVRINHVKENWRDLSDFWLLSMHDNFFGKIPAIKFSFDKKFLFSIGADGNLFAYKWNLQLKPLKVQAVVPVPKLAKKVVDIEDPKFLSLEQQKEKENDEKRRNISTENKNKVLMMIEELRIEFDEIMQKNALLPASQKLTVEDLELDQRISKNVQQKLDFQMDVVRRKKEFDYEKVKLAGKKLLQHFIDPIDFPIQVIGITNSKTVFSFRIKKLGEDFYHLRDEMEMRIMQASKIKRMDLMDASIRTGESESTVPMVESFLIGLTPVDIEMKLESKMRRLLNKYRERKSKELARKKEWHAINGERPNPEIDHPNDKKLIEEAQQTMGNYKLKSDPKYEANDEQRETVQKKLQELLKTREDVYKIRNDYNVKVFALRDKKKSLIEYIQRKLKQLDKIHDEIPESRRVEPQIAVAFNFDKEYPERNLDLNKYLKSEEFSASPSRVKGTLENIASPRDIIEKVLMDVQRKILLVSHHDIEDIPKSPNLRMKLFQRASSADKNDSEWEDEMKNLRTHRRLFEQEQIVTKINARIEEFDSEIENLSDDRYDVEVKAKFKENFLLTLNHELLILRDFESNENTFAEVVDAKDSERKILLNRIEQTKCEMEMFKKTVEEYEDSIHEIEKKFNEHCTDNKFTPFLRRIFKKKLPAGEFEKNADDEEMEKHKSESDDSSEGGSIDENFSEHKTGMKHLSENQCPKNCDQRLYELTFELRHERHEIEAALKAKRKEIEAYRLDIESMTERQLRAEADFEANRTQLTELRRTKQEMLNSVNTVVCLKMDQMQYFKNQAEFEDVNNTLLFNNHNVVKLYSRVGKLALETIEAKRKHRINVIHLAKMKTDIKVMEKQISDLKEGTSQAMLKKFGRVIDLNEVEETILRRFAFEMQVEMRANAEDIKRQYADKINELKKAKTGKEETLNRVIQEATEKLNILTVLEEEKNFLYRIISMQSRKKESRSAGSSYGIDNDLSKLKEISHHQKEQIEMLQREIRALSLKTKSFIDARQDYDQLNYSITQLRGECRFEDSICSNPDESMLSSTRATTPDNEIFNDILKTVKAFAEINLSDQLEDVEIENVTLNVAKYLTNVAINFPSTEADDILPEVITNFSNFLPKHARVAPENVANLVAQIIGNMTESNEVNRGEILKEIINSTIEAANQTAISSSSYLQLIITELFKQMVITLRFTDVASPECVTEIVERLSKLNAVQTVNVNVDDIVREIVEHANENMEDDIDGHVLRRVISSIISKLTL